MRLHRLEDSGDQPSARLIEQLFRRIGEVSSLPDVALRIIELVSDPATGTDELLEAVRSDPALAMRVMRTVNSAYCALEQKVGDLRQAVTLLGFNEIRNLALTAYVARMFQKGDSYGRYSRRGLWTHMVATAMVAQRISRLCRLAGPEEAYLAGLLHDLGLILIDQYLHEPFCRVVDRLTDATPICDVERRALGFDHAQLGEFVAANWRLPEHLSAAIGSHHHPERYDGPCHAMVCVVALADVFCHLKGFPALGVNTPSVTAAPLLVALGMQREQLELLLENLDDTLATANLLAVIQTR